MCSSCKTAEEKKKNGRLRQQKYRAKKKLLKQAAARLEILESSSADPSREDDQPGKAPLPTALQKLEALPAYRLGPQPNSESSISHLQDSIVKAVMKHLFHSETAADLALPSPLVITVVVPSKPRPLAP